MPDVTKRFDSDLKQYFSLRLDSTSLQIFFALSVLFVTGDTVWCHTEHSQRYERKAQCLLQMQLEGARRIDFGYCDCDFKSYGTKICIRNVQQL